MDYLLVKTHKYQLAISDESSRYEFCESAEEAEKRTDELISDNDIESVEVFKKIADIDKA